MTAAATWSRGWGCGVWLGEGQAHAQAVLRAAVRHKSRTWHQAPPLRAFDRSPGTAHRNIHDLVRLGVVAIQASLGCQGGIRFTFGVARFMWRPPRRAQVARMGVLVPQGQLDLRLPETAPKPPEIDKPPETAPLERPRTAENGDGGVRVQSEFQQGMARYGCDWGGQ
jgi:hypothetical protein